MPQRRESLQSRPLLVPFPVCQPRTQILARKLTGRFQRKSRRVPCRTAQTALGRLLRQCRKFRRSLSRRNRRLIRRRNTHFLQCGFLGGLLAHIQNTAAKFHRRHIHRADHRALDRRIFQRTRRTAVDKRHHRILVRRIDARRLCRPVQLLAVFHQRIAQGRACISTDSRVTARQSAQNTADSCRSKRNKRIRRLLQRRTPHLAHIFQDTVQTLFAPVFLKLLPHIRQTAADTLALFPSLAQLPSRLRFTPFLNLPIIHILSLQLAEFLFIARQIIPRHTRRTHRIFKPARQRRIVGSRPRILLRKAAILLQTPDKLPVFQRIVSDQITHCSTLFSPLSFS
ncbi:Uncharacterised protein [Neisseria meningitidis]|nr:Uncharacterised protein [Neisseria meningitidis]